MKVLNFSVKPQVMRASNGILCGDTNGLFSILQRGYSDHIPIVIRPDDIWNNIACIWSKYVVLNAERFRSFFVDHEGQKVLTYESGGSYSDDRMPEFMSGLISLVKNDQDKDNLSWLDMETSTTINSDRLLRSASTLASQKKYYTYRCCLSCGFSSVILMGDEHDWAHLKDKLNTILALDDDLGKWKERLINTVNSMHEGDESFWQRCIARSSFGSGPRLYNGWILDFNPFDEKGKWLTTMEDYDVLNLTVDFDININDNGNIFDVSVYAGPNGAYNYDGAIGVKNGFHVTKKVS